MVFGKDQDPSEAGKKGGASLTRKLILRKKCTKSCPVWDKCDFRTWRGTSLNPSRSCMLNTMKPEIKNHLVRLIAKDTNAIKDEVFNSMIKILTIMSKISTTDKDMLKTYQTHFNNMIKVANTYEIKQQQVSMNANVNSNLYEDSYNEWKRKVDSIKSERKQSVKDTGMDKATKEQAQNK